MFAAPVMSVRSLFSRFLSADSPGTVVSRTWTGTVVVSSTRGSRQVVGVSGIVFGTGVGRERGNGGHLAEIMWSARLGMLMGRLQFVSGSWSLDMD